METNAYDAILPLGPCTLGVLMDGAEALRELRFLPPDVPTRLPSSPAARSLSRLIETWLDDPSQRLEWRLAPRGSPFQQRVWAAIAAIPPGQTLCYGDIARGLGSAPRAVGQACGANPFPLLVPCHRVVSASSLGGFANARDGWLLETKRWLLAREGHA